MMPINMVNGLMFAEWLYEAGRSEGNYDLYAGYLAGESPDEWRRSTPQDIAEGRADHDYQQTKEER